MKKKIYLDDVVLFLYSPTYLLLNNKYGKQMWYI
jgi:hypothetical protein